jgi:Ser/Thr protein kinase RdoA (MazF antagonist)
MASEGSGTVCSVDGAAGIGSQAAEAERAATTVARNLGLAGSLELLRGGANHVFRVGDAVFRVTATDVDAVSQIALLRWLSDQGLPVLRPVSDAIAVDGVQVTVWEYIAGQGRIDYHQLGEAIARLHRLAPSRVGEHIALPWCGDTSWLQLGENLDVAARAGVVTNDDIEVLRAVTVELAGWQEEARHEQLVVCHGDVHPQNVVMRGDELVILDWDSICLGPRAWDHAALLTWAERWGGHPGAYRAFADGYGADLRDSPDAQLLARVRLLAPTVNMILGGRTSPRAAEEARLRMRYWRGDPSAPAWTPQ